MILSGFSRGEKGGSCIIHPQCLCVCACARPYVCVCVCVASSSDNRRHVLEGSDPVLSVTPAPWYTELQCGQRAEITLNKPNNSVVLAAALAGL